MPFQAPTPPAPVTPVAPVEAPVTPVQGPATLSGLQAQAAELRVQLAGLDAQWRSLKTQLDQMLRTNPARPGVQQRWADVAVQKAQVEGDLARVEAQIAERAGVPGIPGVPNLPHGPRFVRNRNEGLQIGAILFLVVLVSVSVARLKRFGRSSPRPASLSREATERLERMEQAIDAVAIEVERISEGQRFVTKILAERRSQATPQPDSAPNDQSMRALGAGPAELVQVRERESIHEKANE